MINLQWRIVPMEIMNSCRARRSSFGVSLKLSKSDGREKIQEPVVGCVHQAILKSEQLKGLWPDAHRWWRVDVGAAVRLEEGQPCVAPVHEAQVMLMISWVPFPWGRWHNVNSKGNNYLLYSRCWHGIICSFKPLLDIISFSLLA